MSGEDKDKCLKLTRAFRDRTRRTYPNQKAVTGLYTALPANLVWEPNVSRCVGNFLPRRPYYRIIPVESLRYGQLSTIASDIARRNIGYTIQ
jgi:hypothetical protein